MGVGGLPQLPDGWGLARSMIRIGRSDRSLSTIGVTAVSSDLLVEEAVLELEQKRSLRPIFEIDRSDQFFYGWANGERGVTEIFGSREDHVISV